ncbi:helix-turn-helix transcriptional regulator [Paractinoplanes globisporus]|uniref:AraC family transcriptional regulator ligand-binding domain-containing protein n=1 Tax=Paractinoplanes globisporus TaxID=113565 RepID=A0ABW6W646_9ACTN|nr:AraC family transcriptional regulator [Actinoplanes globisporus]
MTTGPFALSPSTAASLADLGVPAAAVLSAAGLPGDLFLAQQVRLTRDQFYRLWRALEEVSGDPAIGAALAERVGTEAFQPPLFAALCSPDLTSAAERLAVHKRLIGPLVMHVDTVPEGLRLTVDWPPDPPPPPGLLAYELAFIVGLARLGTRTRVVPLRIAMPTPPTGAAAETYRNLLGVPLTSSPSVTVTFSALDARRPFLTANDEMWQFFEPELRRRLADLDRPESTTDRVRATLLELLPAGQPSAPAVARRLALSPRTLQRRLADEDTTFQAVLEQTRLSLARHYLDRPDVTIAEIAFLLGYDEPSSFYRAFHRWSGTTPHQARAAATS